MTHGWRLGVVAPSLSPSYTCFENYYYYFFFVYIPIFLLSWFRQYRVAEFLLTTDFCGIVLASSVSALIVTITHLPLNKFVSLMLHTMECHICAKGCKYVRKEVIQKVIRLSDET